MATKKIEKVVKINGLELALIIAEAAIGVKRPPGATIEEALEYFDPETRQGFINAAQKATEYVLNQFGESSRMQ